MKLLDKTLAIICVTLVGMILLMYIASQIIVINSYADLEKDSMVFQVRSALNELTYDQATLSTSCVDYAYWNDSYYFAGDGNRQYIDNNFMDGTFANQRLNLIVVTNASDGIVYASGYDFETESQVPIAEDFLNHVERGDLLLRMNESEGMTGIIRLERGPMLVSSFPILRSDVTGPVAGTMIMGRYLDEQELTSLRNITGMSIRVESYDTTPTSDDFARARPLLTPSDPIAVLPRENNTVGGYGLVEDIYGEPVLILAVDQPRTIYNQGQSSMMYLIMAIIFCGLVFSIVIIYLLERLVLSPIAGLSANVQNIGSSGDLAKRVQVKGDDEVAVLAMTINGTLDTLDHSRQKLHASELRFRSLVENISDIVWELDDRLVFTYVSTNVKEILGYEPAEILGKTAFDLMKTEDAVRARGMIDEIIRFRQSSRLVEFTLIGRDGESVIIESTGSRIRDLQGKMTGFHGVARNITARKQEELTLRKWADIFRSTKTAIAIIAPESMTVEMVNPAFLRMYGYDEAEILGKPISGLFENAKVPDLREHLRVAGQSGHHVFESQTTGKDGGVIPVNVDVSLVRDEKGTMLYRILNLQDIAERRQAEEAVRTAYDELINSNKALQAEIGERRKAEDKIRASLKEKEVLLKEIHHRVKNNLQIISSLLNLQSGSITPENAVSAFMESQHRIKSMALIHEKLYQSDDLAHIDFDEYVNSLTAFLARSYRMNAGVSLAIDVKYISLDIDKAIPCGLIINELVSNSLKYAFPEGRQGVISIAVSRSNNTYLMEIRDSGVGLPPDMDYRESPSLGLQLVNMLVEQMEGSIEKIDQPGTGFRIRFEEEGA